MAYRLHPVTAASITHAPPPCVGCVFWQSGGRRSAPKGKWADRVEDEWGPWGTLYFGDEDRLYGFMQYGPAALFPRAFELPAGPPSDDAVLVTCAYLVDQSAPWVMQSLFLAAIGEARDKGAKGLEAFAYRYPEGESAYERFHVHRTIFPRDFLSDFGFLTVRASEASPHTSIPSAASAMRTPIRVGGSLSARSTRIEPVPELDAPSSAAVVGRRATLCRLLLRHGRL